ncbi:hypothetical protein MLD38_004360 [Melastoma candidum]|uniref:Uncharacterized protein n=1 Tax=Melastoma candidum TaxID=119954 RepID=A0ACB9S556_9MYRT|nr:hypothetical protein MLD38_004360 [Melastoma candidum]
MGVCESKERSNNGSDSGGEVTSWRVEDRRPDAVDIAVGVGLAVVVAGLGLYVMSRMDRKTMKAPGRSHYRMYRDDFEDDPAGYFRGLRRI